MILFAAQDWALRFSAQRRIVLYQNACWRVWNAICLFVEQVVNQIFHEKAVQCLGLEVDLDRSEAFAVLVSRHAQDLVMLDR